MQFKCSRCGGEVPVVSDDQFADCPYCRTSLFLHFEGSSEHYLLKPVIGAKLVPSVLEKWLRQHDYSGVPGVRNLRSVFFPFWLFKTEKSGRLLPAAPDPSREIPEISMSAGDLRFFNAAECAGAEVVSASLYISAARARFGAEYPQEKSIKGEHLLHYPLYIVDYGYGDVEYRAVVDAVSGQVYTHDRPPPESAARSRLFLTLAAVAFTVFFTVDVSLDSFPLELLLDSVLGIGMYFLGRSYLESGGSSGEDA